MLLHALKYTLGASHHVIVGGSRHPFRVQFKLSPTWQDFHGDKGAILISAPAAPAACLMNFCRYAFNSKQCWSWESSIVWN